MISSWNVGDLVKLKRLEHLMIKMLKLYNCEPYKVRDAEKYRIISFSKSLKESQDKIIEQLPVLEIYEQNIISRCFTIFKEILNIEFKIKNGEELPRGLNFTSATSLEEYISTAIIFEKLGFVVESSSKEAIETLAAYQTEFATGVRANFFSHQFSVWWKEKKSLNEQDFEEAQDIIKTLTEVEEL